MNRPDNRSTPCPCGSAATYADCCGALHSGSRPALTAQELMRSRYSAFAVGNANYLVDSWAPEAQVDKIDFVPDQRWLGLTIHETAGGGPFDRIGTVRFTARYESEAGPGELTEVSLFRRHGDQWVYVGPAAG